MTEITQVAQSQIAINNTSQRNLNQASVIQSQPQQNELEKDTVSISTQNAQSSGGSSIETNGGGYIPPN